MSDALQTTVAAMPPLELPRAVRRNLLNYSEDLRNTAAAGSARPWDWMNGGMVDLLADEWSRVYALEGGNVLPYINQTLSLVAANAVLSFEVKKTSAQTPVFFGVVGTAIGPGASGTSSIYLFDLSTLELTNVGGATSTVSVTPLGTDHYRIDQSVLCGTITAVRFYARRTNLLAAEGFAVRRVQVEAGAVASAYQKIETLFPPVSGDPPRIASLVGSSLAATLAADLPDAQIVALEDHGVTYERRAIPVVDPYLVQSGRAFRERVILSPDVPPATVKRVMLNIKRAWRDPRAVMHFPQIGEALAGGFYVGAAWDTVTTSPSTLTIGLGAHTLAISGGTSLPLFVGQWVTLAPVNNTAQVFMRGAITAVTNDAVSVVVDGVTGSGAHTSWVIACPWRVILAPKVGGESTGNIAYKIESSAAPIECQTLTNGRAATAAMIAANVAAGSIVYPAADFIAQMNSAALGGKTDWELGARDWNELIARNLKSYVEDNFLAVRPKVVLYTRDANGDDVLNEPRGLNRHAVPWGAGYTAKAPAQTPLSLFLTGGSEMLTKGVAFWSCSEYSPTGGWYTFNSLTNIGYQATNGKINAYRIRAVRREILEAA